jgi:hypothetical protein
MDAAHATCQARAGGTLSAAAAQPIFDARNRFRRWRGAAVPRPRDHILANLESLYRESFTAAAQRGDESEKRRLDFDFRRDQLYLEAILDVRDLLAAASPPPSADAPGDRSVLEQISDLRNLTRLPFGR